MHTPREDQPCHVAEVNSLGVIAFGIKFKVPLQPRRTSSDFLSTGRPCLHSQLVPRHRALFPPDAHLLDASPPLWFFRSVSFSPLRRVHL